MAVARIVHQYDDGSACELTVEVDESYPDAVDEACARVMDLWREVVAVDDGDET